MPSQTYGWIKNTENSSDGPAHKLYAASPYLIDIPDYRTYARNPALNGYRFDQKQAGSCWAFATSRDIQLYYAVRGIVAPIASQRFLYWNGRNEQFAGQPPVPGRQLPDEGTEPRLGLRAVEGVGFCALEDCPYSDDETIIRTQPGDDAYLAAYSQKGMTWGDVAQTGDARGAAVYDLGRRGFPAQFGMSVDPAFEAWTPDKGPIASIDENNVLGGHMLTVLFVDMLNKLVFFDNQWENWGTPEGFGVMTLKLFGSSIVGDVSTAKYAPKLVRMAA